MKVPLGQVFGPPLIVQQKTVKPSQQFCVQSQLWLCPQVLPPAPVGSGQLQIDAYAVPGLGRYRRGPAVRAEPANVTRARNPDREIRVASKPDAFSTTRCVICCLLD